MGFVYRKGHRGSTGEQAFRWFASVDVAGNPVRVSLNLDAGPEGKECNARAANRRFAELQADLDSGTLGTRTQSWLGPLAARLKHFLKMTSPACSGGWAQAVADYLESCGAKDTPFVPAGKLPARHAVKAMRAYYLNRFLSWTTDTGRSFGGPIDADIVDFCIYLSSRKFKVDSDGRDVAMSAVTIRRGFLPYLALFGDWMAERGVCDRPNRRLIKASIPEEKNHSVVLPDFADDMAALRTLYAARMASGTNWSAWCYLAVVRGLGCRPSEASSLSWETVDLTPGSEKVRFLETKEGAGRRTAPVLFTWVRDALLEMKSRSSESAVCVRPRGGHFKGQTESAGCFRNAMKALGLRGAVDSPHDVTPKRAQKLYIMQLIRLGFPPHVVAFWTGHTLSVQEKHYIQEDAYLPSDPKDYAEFGVLSDYGMRAFLRFRGDPGFGNQSGNLPA